METHPEPDWVHSPLYNVGNQVPRYSGWKLTRSRTGSIAHSTMLETKYRDIADGNSHSVRGEYAALGALETKYRDIADGN